MRRRWGLKAIAKDLLANGYDGGISIEPHLAVVHHDPGIQAPEDIKFANYFEYGRRFMQLVYLLASRGTPRLEGPDWEEIIH